MKKRSYLLVKIGLVLSFMVLPGCEDCLVKTGSAGTSTKSGDGNHDSSSLPPPPPPPPKDEGKNDDIGESFSAIKEHEGKEEKDKNDLDKTLTIGQAKEIVKGKTLNKEELSKSISCGGDIFFGGDFSFLLKWAKERGTLVNAFKKANEAEKEELLNTLVSPIEMPSEEELAFIEISRGYQKAKTYQELDGKEKDNAKKRLYENRKKFNNEVLSQVYDDADEEQKKQLLKTMVDVVAKQAQKYLEEDPEFYIGKQKDNWYKRESFTTGLDFKEFLGKKIVEQPEHLSFITKKILESDQAQDFESCEKKLRNLFFAIKDVFSVERRTKWGREKISFCMPKYQNDRNNFSNMTKLFKSSQALFYELKKKYPHSEDKELGKTILIGGVIGATSQQILDTLIYYANEDWGDVFNEYPSENRIASHKEELLERLNFLLEVVEREKELLPSYPEQKPYYQGKVKIVFEQECENQLNLGNFESLMTILEQHPLLKDEEDLINRLKAAIQ